MSALKEMPLPTLSAALEQRYPGVRVQCWQWEWDDGQSGYSYRFEADSAELLLRYGLATFRKRYGAVELVAVGAPEISGHGSYESERTAYVFHCLRDGDPRVFRKGQTYPPKKTLMEVERIWKRISSPSRRHAARPPAG